MMQRFLRTTSEVFDAIDDKSIYKDSIIFIEDTKLIWTNGIYYASVNAEEAGDSEDIEDGDISNFSGDAKDVIYISEFVEYNNVQDMLDYLLSLHKCDFDESFNNDFGFSPMPETSFDLTFDITFK